MLHIYNVPPWSHMFRDGLSGGDWIMRALYTLVDQSLNEVPAQCAVGRWGPAARCGPLVVCLGGYVFYPDSFLLLLLPSTIG